MNCFRFQFALVLSRGPRLQHKGVPTRLLADALRLLTGHRCKRATQHHECDHFAHYGNDKSRTVLYVYWTAMFTTGASEFPTFTTTGTDTAVSIDCGMRTFTCKTLETISGAVPAYRTSAGFPPIVTVTFSSGATNLDAISPVMPPKASFPAPFKY